MNTALAMFFIDFAAVFIVELVVIPAIQQAEAANAISDARNKGKQGESSSEGKMSRSRQ